MKLMNKEHFMQFIKNNYWRPPPPPPQYFGPGSGGDIPIAPLTKGL